MIPSIWTAVYVEFDLPGAFRVLHACGWRVFEVSTEHLEALEAHPNTEGQVERARDCLDELGAVAPQAHAHLLADVAAADASQRQTDVARLEHHLRIAAGLGARAVVIHPGGRKGFTTRAEWRRIRALNVEAFRRLGDVAGEQGLRIGLENMTHHGAATPPEMLDLVAAVDHPAVGLTLDTSHAHAAGLDVADVVREFGPHLVGTHISDNDGSGDQHRLPGGGTVDWPAVMRAFGEVGFDGPANLEIPGERHPVPALHRLKVCFARQVAEWLVELADVGA